MERQQILYTKTEHPNGYIEFCYEDVDANKSWYTVEVPGYPVVWGWTHDEAFAQAEKLVAADRDDKAIEANMRYAGGG